MENKNIPEAMLLREREMKAILFFGKIRQTSQKNLAL
jgi:hypothetical protein